MRNEHALRNNISSDLCLQDAFSANLHFRGVIGLSQLCYHDIYMTRLLSHSIFLYFNHVYISSHNHGQLLTTCAYHHAFYSAHTYPTWRSIPLSPRNSSVRLSPPSLSIAPKLNNHSRACRRQNQFPSRPIHQRLPRALPTRS